MAKNWKEEIERERKLLAASVITPEERADIDALAERDKLRNERLANEAARLDVEIENRLDAARDALGDTRIGVVIVEGTEHSFIVKDPGSKAYIQWEKDVHKSRIKGSGVDLSQVTRTIALVAVHDWNGITDWKSVDENGEPYGTKLVELLKASPGIATLLSGEATDLAGLSRGDKKSKG